MGVVLGFSHSWYNRNTEINRTIPVEGQSANPTPSFPPYDPNDRSLRELLSSNQTLSAQASLFQSLQRLNPEYATLLERFPDRGAVNLLTQLSQLEMTPEQAAQQLDPMVMEMITHDAEARLDTVAEEVNESLPDPSPSVDPGSQFGLDVNVNGIDNSVTGQLTYRNVFSSSADTSRRDSFQIRGSLETETVDATLGFSYERAREWRVGEQTREEFFQVDGQVELR